MSDLAFQFIVDIRPFYRLRSFYGRNIDQMPVLLADGRVPMTPRQLLYERVHGENEHDRDLLCNNYVDTACAVVTDNSGEVLIGLYSDPLVKGIIHSLHPQCGLQNGALPVGADAYHEIRKNGALVIPARVASGLRSNARNHQKTREAFWDYVAEGDQTLVDDHLRLVQERCGGDMSNRMALWVSDSPGLQLLCARSVGDDYGDASGGSHLDNYYGYGGGRLAGVLETQRVFRPENQGFSVGSAGGAAGTKSARERAAQKTESNQHRGAARSQGSRLEEAVQNALDGGRAFEYNELLYVPVQKDKGVRIT